MTPIFELSSKLFPSSDVRGCENRQNHSLHSGPILHYVHGTGGHGSALRSLARVGRGFFRVNGSLFVVVVVVVLFSCCWLYSASLAPSLARPADSAPEAFSRDSAPRGRPVATHACSSARIYKQGRGKLGVSQALGIVAFFRQNRHFVHDHSVYYIHPLQVTTLRRPLKKSESANPEDEAASCNLLHHHHHQSYRAKGCVNMADQVSRGNARKWRHEFGTTSPGNFARRGM